MAASNRETAGVGLAFVGFVVIVLGFRGTWQKVWHDLWGSGGVNTSDPAGTGYTGPTLPNSTTTPGTVLPGSNGGPDQLVPTDPHARTIPLAPEAAYTIPSLRLPNTRVQTPIGLLT